MRVALLVTDLERGGTPLRIARLARGLRELGIDVHVGCLAPAGPVSANLERAGFRVFDCGARNARDLAVFARLARHLRAIRPDVLHATLTHANIAARIVGRWLRIPVVTSTATIEVERRSHRLLESITAHWDRAHIVNSAAVADHVRRHFHISPRRIHVIPPAIDVPPAAALQRAPARAQFDLAEHECAIVWAGRFDVVKRLPILIECAELLNDIPARFLIAGDGPERAKIEQRVRMSGAGNRILLLGWQTDLLPLYAAADVMIFPSLTEGMPNAVLEAMACGVCVIGSDIPALRELVGDERRLCLVRSDEPRSYTAAARELWRDAALRRAIGNSARRWAETHCSVESAAKALLSVYERVVSNRGST